VFVLLQESRDSVAKIRSSLLNLVDLAGSERQRDTHTEGLRLKVINILMYVYVHICITCVRCSII